MIRGVAVLLVVANGLAASAGTSPEFRKNAAITCGKVFDAATHKLVNPA